MVLLIDNYDSFTHNLAQAMLCEGAEVVVRRNDDITAAEARGMRPSHEDLCSAIPALDPLPA